MPAHRPLAPTGHRRVARLPDRRRFEALVDGEAEDERISGGEATLHLVDVLEEALVGHGAVELRVGVALRGRLAREPGDVIWPLGLRAHAVAGHRLDAVADHGAAVDRCSALDEALVVINEETRRHEVAELLLQTIELDRARD